MKWNVSAAAILLIVFCMALALRGQTMPAASATELIGRVKTAYGQLTSLKLHGTLMADLDVGGKTQKKQAEFSADYLAPLMFRHELKGEVLAGSTGEKVYILETARNVFMTADASKSREAYRQLPVDLGQLLDMQDPGLVLAISKNSIDDLLEGATGIERKQDSVVGGKSLATLEYASADGRKITLCFDPKTFLLQQATYDLAEVLRSRGAAAINNAKVTFAYDQAQAGAKMDNSLFAWNPPANAREVSGEADVMAATALQGQKAPDFTLKDLDGKDVKLSSLKGSVVLLDFWATWCAPCVRSLPEVNGIYQAMQGRGVKVFAVNKGETTDDIKPFLAGRKLDLPVLLDTDEKVCNAFSVEAIPTTIVIRPDGVVSKVFVGIPPGGRAEVERAIAAAMK